MHKYAKIVILFLFSILIVGCSSSFEDTVDEASKKVEEVFKQDPMESNQENDVIEYYLPFWYEMIDETEFNILLKNGSKQYILFYNPNEDVESRVVFNATNEVKDYDYVKTFEHDNQFGYFLVKSLDDNRNEVVVGVGGVKLTGEMKTSSLKSEVEMMMKIAHSVILKDK